jgi:trigger factor
MDVTETLAEGLKREYRVVVPASDLDVRVNERLIELKDRVRLNGFRPGKVPVAHLKRIYGRGVMAEAIDEAVKEANASIIADRGFKLAMEPKVTLPTAESEVKEVLDGKVDFTYSVAMEILPKIELADVKGIKLEKLIADVTDQEVTAAIDRIAAQNRPFSAKPPAEAAEKGDRVMVSFSGTIDGKPFEGGTGKDIAVEIGSNTFIPGFEDQLIGIRSGETRTITATFPQNYVTPTLAGKTGVFEVTADAVEAPVAVTVDDELAKSVGLESLAKLKDAVRDRLTREYALQTRQRLKRALLDALDERHKFDLPPTLVEQEFANVWQTVLNDLAAQNRSFADEGTTEEAAKAEYRDIAERRVRLGLVLAEIGEKNGIKVTDDELNRALAERARQFRGQEQKIWDYYRKNPAAVAAVRAPIYEDKVADFLLELVTVTERHVGRDELYQESDAAPAKA